MSRHSLTMNELQWLWTTFMEHIPYDLCRMGMLTFTFYQELNGIYIRSHIILSVLSILHIPSVFSTPLFIFCTLALNIFATKLFYISLHFIEELNQFWSSLSVCGGNKAKQWGCIVLPQNLEIRWRELIFSSA